MESDGFVTVRIENAAKQAYNSNKNRAAYSGKAYDSSSFENIVTTGTRTLENSDCKNPLRNIKYCIFVYNLI